MVGLLVGCSKPPEPAKTVAELRAIAIDARDEAQESNDPEQAARAARKAEEAATKAAQMIEAAAEASEADKKASEEAAEAARQAEWFADLVREEKDLADIASGWKARAYRGTRKVALAAVFRGLALAAEQAGKSDLASLPQGVQDSAKLAAQLAPEYAGRKDLPDGQPDWAGIASDLTSFSSQPPPGIALLTALASVLSGQNRVALYEIELVDRDSLRTREQNAQYHVLRAVILAQNDLRHLAVRELETSDLLRAEGGAQCGPQMLAGVHLLLAYFYLNDGRYREADLQIVRAMQAWPDNPVAIYLTGERLAATGEYEKAADSLEHACRGTKHEWLAKRIAERARDLRDRKEKAEPLLTEFGFVREVAVQYVWEAANESEAAARVRKGIATAREFGEKMLASLPGSDAPTR